jgi:two-component system, OmpR family, phosphate regulon sensor histidine kinase PhoR
LDTNSIPKRWSPKLVLQFVAPALVALAGAAAVPYVSLTLERDQIDTLARRLTAEARVAGDLLPWARDASLDDACARLSTTLEVRVTVLAADGAVLCESSRASAELGSHADRPEVRQALTMGTGASVRWSETAQTRLVYAAVREEREGTVRVVRVAIPADAVLASAAQARRLALLVVVLALVLAVVVAFVLAGRMLRRLQRLVGFSSRLAAGEPAPYLSPERRDDLGVLEAQLSEMARRVAGTIAELRVEQERLEAILRGMVEGVLVTDMRGNVVLMNARARQVLGIALEDAPPGRPLVEITRDPAMGELLRELEAGAPIASRDVALGAGQGPTLQVNGARLRAADGQVFGFVIVLHDVTELRRLEVIRRDFVANVSHELRTPLTAIKGYAETLLGSAGDDRETARRFLAVIDRHSERLGRLIDDLLTLSDLELGRTPLRIGAVAMGPVVDDVLQIFAEPVARAGVRVEAQVAPGLALVQADGDRLRQVLINLVDNAIKYTPKGGQVLVRALAATGPEHVGMVEIAIEDSGIGIPAQDLPRLTERFFRVDKARSRELGGTGLGLAIVKHIVQAHGGSLAISSALGQGTTVRVFFPAAQGQEQRAPLTLVRR